MPLSKAKVLSEIRKGKDLAKSLREAYKFKPVNSCAASGYPGSDFRRGGPLDMLRTTRVRAQAPAPSFPVFDPKGTSKS